MLRFNEGKMDGWMSEIFVSRWERGKGYTVSRRQHSWEIRWRGSFSGTVCLSVTGEF